MTAQTPSPSSDAPQANSACCFGLVAWRRCPLPTLRGGLVLVLLLGAGIYGFLHTAAAFLSIHDPGPSNGVLVVEGWAPDQVLMQARAEFERHPYKVLVVTGGPIERGVLLSEFKTYAQLGEAILKRSGMEAAKVQAVPAPEVGKDRTFTSALLLKDWLKAHPEFEGPINLISMGSHARRSRLLFETAFGARVGILAMEDPGYDAKRWWTSSQGVRSVLDEVIAYTYARFVFRAPRA